jgi:LPXTG-site transpeptidase (sortase) family protein
MSGHVDYINHGPAVFWHLRDLRAGDVLFVVLDDGSEHGYRVTDLTYYDAENAPVADIVGQTPEPTITLITCGGDFNSRTHEYDRRLVVRGVREAGLTLANF